MPLAPTRRTSSPAMVFSELAAIRPSLRSRAMAAWLATARSPSAAMTPARVFVVRWKTTTAPTNWLSTRSATGTLILSGPNIYSGPTTIEAGTLEVDDYVNYSPVTIDSGATLTGDGGTGAVTNLGGTYDATLYKVTITDQTCKTADGESTTILGLSLRRWAEWLDLGPLARPTRPIAS